jgi:hypothetical protein
MSYKADIQATRFTAASTTAVIAPPIRVRGIIIASDAGGAGSVNLTTGSKTGTSLFVGDVPNGDVINFTFPEDGIVFPQGVFCSTLTNVTSVTLLTDKYSGPGMTANN